MPAGLAAAEMLRRRGPPGGALAFLADACPCVCGLSAGGDAVSVDPCAGSRRCTACWIGQWSRVWPPPWR